jgi:PAS domain S-box-containing protein
VAQPEANNSLDRRTGPLGVSRAPAAEGLAVAALLTAFNLITDTSAGVGALVLAPLLVVVRGGGQSQVAAIAVLMTVVAVLLGIPDEQFGEPLHLALVFLVALGGVLAVSVARLREQREADSQRLEIQYAVARTLQEARSMHEAAPRLLEAVGRPLGWEIGGLWERRQGRTLRCVESWYAPGVDPKGFDKLSRQFVLRPGVGLPGRVMDTGEAQWMPDVAEERDFPRAELAAKAGLRGAVGFPLRTSAGVVGVMEFFAREPRAPDAGLLELMAALGGQIGEFLEAESAAEALRESEARKTAILESALDCIVSMDHEGRVVEFNPAAERTFGYTREEAVGRTMAELIIPPDLREAHRTSLARNVATGESQILGRRLELRAMCSDGSEFPIELAIDRIPGQSPPMYTGYIRDITERRRAEEERERLLSLERLARVDADRAREQLSAILQGVAEAVTAQAPDGTLLFANDAAVAALGGESLQELLETPVEEIGDRFETFTEDGEPFPMERLPGRLALLGEPAEAVTRQVNVATHEERWTMVKATPIHDDEGNVVMAINVIEDITDLKRSELAQRVLAEVGKIVGSSLEVGDLVQRVAEATTPGLADWCGVHLIGADGRPHTSAVAHVADPRGELITEIDKRWPPDPGAPAGIGAVIRSGDSELYPEVTPELVRERAIDEEHATLIEQVGLYSAVLVPVRSRGQVLGTLTLVRIVGSRRYDEQDVAVCEELGRRLGTAIDNARIYEERSYIAKTLQESLLPAQLPEIPGLETAARFRATGEGNEVGGDFYDLFESGGGSWTIVVGDVCGKGPDAAAVTALARYTLRAAAMREPVPSASLQILNEALLRQRTDMRFATVAYASLVPEAGGARVSLASAGHPLPMVLRADGTVEAVGVPGTLVGVVSDPSIEDRSVTLTPGDALVFYTDGVTDARRNGDIFGEERLRKLLEACRGASADHIAGQVEEAAVEIQHGDARDDIAVVVLRVCEETVARGA